MNPTPNPAAEPQAVRVAPQVAGGTNGQVVRTVYIHHLRQMRISDVVCVLAWIE